ncbi:hypothetical protein DevBK_12995 [Devosia sp. BK]|jgi:hypothetical protein|uniref:hypothetical protein n=1 Tax=unclassified Devosia TaxID=196773 RepID=UPI000A5AE545|nr:MULTISPECIES: hypothetical protein [unclassified Devosia]MDV3252250.1 hypothetical protein [Devosia sp. BK]
MCRNCAGFDEKEQDIWAAAFAHRDGKSAAQKPADAKAAPAPRTNPASRDQTHA